MRFYLEATSSDSWKHQQRIGAFSCQICPSHRSHDYALVFWPAVPRAAFILKNTPDALVS